MEVLIESSHTLKEAEPQNEFSSVVKHLQSILIRHLENSPNLSLNGLSKRCSISEPTLRRIKKGQIKTLPSITTVIDLLCYISKEDDTQKIIAAFPGPVGELLKSKVAQVTQIKSLNFSEELSKSLKDPTKYVIYKLATSDYGITVSKALELFGRYGERQLATLAAEGLLEERGGAYFAKISCFSLSHEVFIDHFKTLADFIKPHKLANAAKKHSPLFINYSSNVNKEAYSEILRIQRSALRKITNVLSDENSSGNIPAFVLSAIDTIDTMCADEFPDEDQ